MNLVTKYPHNIPKYECNYCDIKTNNKKDFEKHKTTAKHQKNTKGDNVGDKKIIKSLIIKCNKCNKIYNSRNGLWKHKKICKNEEENLEDEQIDEFDDKQTIHLLIKENIDFKNIILDLVKNNGDLQKQTQEMQKQIIDVCKNNNTTINSNNNHSNNKTFNMQLFLNEKCKDAMNIMEFVDSFQLQLSDLENVGKLGYVEGISNIIIKKLNELDVHKRPVHCSDAKREVMYVKDNDVWEKEGSGYMRLRKAIKYISKKNSDLLPVWSENNPASQNISSRVNDEYIRMVLQAMGGSGEIEENENKIIRKISKLVYIDK